MLLVRRLLRIAALVCIVVPFVGTAPSAPLTDDEVTLSSDDVDYLDDLQLGPDIEWELSKFELAFFPRAGVEVLFPNPDDTDLAVSAAARKGAKLLLRRVVLEHGGALTGYWNAGTLAGIEIEWFPAVGSSPPTALRLADLADVWDDNAQTPPQRARVVAYDAVQLAARRAALEAAQGASLTAWTCWADRGTTATDTAGPGILVSGPDNSFHGVGASAEDFEIVVGGNDFADGIEYVGKYTKHTDSTVWNKWKVSSVPSVPVPFTESAARSEAIAAGNHYASSVEFTSSSPPPAGLIFCEQDILVTGLNLAGTWTFVSAGGKVVVSGDGNVIVPAKDHVAMVSFGGRVAVTGDGNELAGELLAPQDSLLVSGQDNTIRGLVQALDVRVSGSDNLVSDGTDPHSNP